MRRILVAAACLVPVSAADAESLTVGGHVKYQYSHTVYRSDDLAASLVDADIDDHSLDLRLKGEGRSGAWDFAAHYELLATSGSDWLALRQRMVALGLVDADALTGLPNDKHRLFDLTDEIGGDSRVAVQRLDRLFIGYRSGGAIWRFGRQVVSWGNGLVFHPLDFVNPFSPVAVDKDYKSGDDMLYGQWALGGGSEAATGASLHRGPRLDPIGDMQVIVLPRRDPGTHAVKGEESTLAAKLRFKAGGNDLEVLAARHVDEYVLGAGVVRSLNEAVWRLDASVADVRADGGVWSAVTNLDYSWTWGGKNVYGFVEYFRNGFGERDAARYLSPNAALAARLARGELYTLARNYAVVGLHVELAPLFNLFTNVIRNLDDASHVVQVRAVYDWREDVSIMAGLNLPFGERGDEYGGIPGPGGFISAGRTAYVRAVGYF